jgi:NAD(P)-dependent dehydrogenase (short-subunit alcohol dehydrogenase family)
VPTVLVTGASRGIGRAVALNLAQAGWDVYAGVREVGPESAGERITPVLLDVTEPDHIAALGDVLPETVDALVNNAGIVVGGPVEGLDLDDLRYQLEVNLVGQIAVTQAVLPRIRAAHGRIIFISSINGRLAAPMIGAYNASKFALEAIADTLRVELRPWGVDVIVVEPGSTDTDIWRGALDELAATEDGLSDEIRDLYRPHIEGTRKATRFIQKHTFPVEQVVDAVNRAVTARRPRARYVVGAATKAQLGLANLTPTRALDATLARMSGIPGER